MPAAILALAVLLVRGAFAQSAQLDPARIASWTFPPPGCGRRCGR